MNTITLAVLDMAGTTVSDEGVVEQAFADAYNATRVMRAYGSEADVRAYAISTMGQSKIEVFSHLTSSSPDAIAANFAFEAAYSNLIAAGACTAIPGIVDTFARMRSANISIVLTTGFSKRTQNALIDHLGWAPLIDAALCPADAGRGRPFPDLNLTAVLRTRTVSVADMLVAGDTASDILSATRAGAGRSVGVLTGAYTEQQLREAGASDILASAAELPALLGI